MAIIIGIIASIVLVSIALGGFGAIGITAASIPAGKQSLSVDRIHPC
jgi:hypothetical protein